MKTYFILCALLFMGFSATAQKPNKAIATTSPEKYVNSTLLAKHFVLESKHIEIQSGKELVRLYKYKNSRIKKALSFTTPRDKAKLV